MAVNELIVTAEFVSNILNEPLEESGGGRVKSVNGMIGDVVLTAEDIGYDGTTIADALGSLAEELDNKAAIIVSSASGAIASFPDGSGGTVKSLVAQIEPKQDLHGYANPWPAGGGKNLLYGMEGGIIDQTTGENASSSSSYSRSVNHIPVTPGQSYTIGKFSGSASFRIFWYGAEKAYIGTELVNNQWIATSLYKYTFTASDNVHFIRFQVVNTAIGDYISTMQVESGSTATDFSPYSNICPISGWTGAEGKRTGANVWDEETESGYISASGGYATNANSLRSKNFCPCVGGKTYYFVKPSTYTTTPNICWYDSEQNFISRSVTSEFPAIPAPSNAKYFKISMWDYGATYNHDISINYPETDTEYHPYTGNQISVTFPDSAGTVYGGTLDVTNGVLTVTHKTIDLGSPAYGYSASFGGHHAVYCDVPDMRFILNTSVAICSKYKCISGGSGAIIDKVCMVNAQAVTSSKATIAVVDDDYSSKDDFVTALTGGQFCYELATSVEYQLTPQEVTTLLGANNIWFDTGDTSVEYPADTKLYIDKVINAAIAAL